MPTPQVTERWLATANRKGSKFILSVCDTFDYEDYPVYCKDQEELDKAYAKYDGKNMQKVNEVIIVENKNKK